MTDEKGIESRTLTTQDKKDIIASSDMVMEMFEMNGLSLFRGFTACLVTVCRVAKIERMSLDMLHKSLDSVHNALKIDGETEEVIEDAEVEEIEEWEYHDTDEIVCPYCKYEFYDSWEYCHSDKEEDVECGECGGEFSVEPEDSRTYYSYKKVKKDEEH